MTVCDITQFWSPVSGGVRRYVAEKIRALRERGGRHLLIIPGENDSVTGDDAARVYTIRSPLVSGTTGYRVLLRLGEIGRIFAAERPDIVESGDPYQVGWRVARECAALGIPCVAFYHSHFAESELRPLGRWLGATAAELLVRLAGGYCARLYNRFARTLVPAPKIARTLDEWGVANTTVVDMGVDVARFIPATRGKRELRADIGLPPDARVLLYVGRLAAEKGTRALCEAFARLPGGYRLVVTGEGIQRPLVERLAGATLVPFQNDHDALLRYYHAADLFVHPGTQETFGLVTAEAQACGLPVVGFRGTAMDRVVCHTQDFWAREHTPAALARAIESAFLHDLPAMGVEARLRVAAQFAWEKVFARQFDLYAEVMQKARRP